ncbi:MULTISPECIES: type II toxin-antitoxin system VapB family antitoxin [Azospirillaceae]|uniref:type II toxin-antitoxin system VapB family antitoxin n=1 Tax=Azospirillaceae TaxID=2829815 RepID=UPI000B6ABFEF|nr:MULTISPECIES: type II toxin-antitoxin system VapB family antitoxin [Azospirillaceae]MDG5494242.1 type II toxin-antitoxin system VapB family antitoxin [Niveispirillum sp. BGYR6]SNR98812.1 antitoxin VapB [Azospirillum sp. RU38E]SNS16184.1 antitoxin VapB [Azospirillum sp. RU37A]
MALNIKSPEAERDVRRLAELTGESLTEAMHKAVRERLERLSAEELALKRARWAKAEEIIRRIQANPVQDARSPDQIIGYNQQGTFD